MESSYPSSVEGTGFPIRTVILERGEQKGNIYLGGRRWKTYRNGSWLLMTTRAFLDSFEVLLGDQYDLLKAGERS